jgi:hypothetical protein
MTNQTNRAISIALAATLALCSAAAQAAEGTGHVTGMTPVNNGAVIIYTEVYSGPTPPAACSTFHRWALDATTPGGRMMAADVTAAYLAGKPIHVLGNGQCAPIYGDTEGVSWIDF